jgi:hypothetical protein
VRGTGGGHKLCGFVFRSAAVYHVRWWLTKKHSLFVSCILWVSYVPFPSFFFPFSPFLDGNAGEYTGWDLMTVCSCMCCVRNSLIPSLISTAEKRKRKQEKFWEYRTTFVEKITRAVQFFFQGYTHTSAYYIHPSVVSSWVVLVVYISHFEVFIIGVHRHGNNRKLSVLAFLPPSGLNVLSLNIT